MSSLATSVGLMSSIPMERVFSVPKAANMFERALGLLPFSTPTTLSPPSAAERRAPTPATPRPTTHTSQSTVSIILSSGMSVSTRVPVSARAVFSSSRLSDGRFGAQPTRPVPAAEAPARPSAAKKLRRLIAPFFPNSFIVTVSSFCRISGRHLYHRVRKSRKTGETYEIQEKAPYTKSTTII